MEKVVFRVASGFEWENHLSNLVMSYKMCLFSHFKQILRTSMITKTDTHPSLAIGPKNKKKETDTLRLQLHSERLQRASLEEQLRNALQDMASWRFESLKSRCVLLNREYLLNEHKIPFEPMQATDVFYMNLTICHQPRVNITMALELLSQHIRQKSSRGELWPGT
ncbi:uncharacterized protein ACN2A1_001231 isoform 1-T1 [Glossina fuscipes fuscipes]